MSNTSINADKPIMELSVYFNKVNLSIDDTNIAALNNCAGYDTVARARIENLTNIITQAYERLSAEYEQLLNDIYDEVETEEISPLQRSTVYYITESEDEADED